MLPLNPSTVDSLPAGIARYSYDRDKLEIGIAHLSVGNFHRAHQAVYLDDCLALPGQSGWGLLGVGIIDSPAERAKADGLKQQQGLYTLTVYPPDAEPTTRVVGSILDYMVAPDDPAAVVERLADSKIRIVSMTITEGGYNIDGKTGEFRLDQPDIVHDLANLSVPRTVFGFITAALKRRREAGTGPFTALSCDNLRHNGDVLRQAILSFARAHDAELAGWIEEHVTFPNSMVDRITPATLPADAARLNERSGIADAVPVFAEDFVQWVIEDRFCAGRPALEQVGVQFTDDVRAFEQVKLRMLNATHSMLAFPGLVGGYRLVHEVLGDKVMADFLATFLNEDVIPLLKAPAGLSLEGYRDTLLARFANPAINDQLERITSDGSSKIPVFLGDTINAAVAGGRDHRRLAFLLAAYLRYLEASDDKGRPFRADEPNLTADDKALATAPDPAAALRMEPFKAFKLSQAFIDDVVRFRGLLTEKGALEIIAGL